MAAQLEGQAAAFGIALLQLSGTHMKTKVYICYIYVGKRRSILSWMNKSLTMGDRWQVYVFCFSILSVGQNTKLHASSTVDAFPGNKWLFLRFEVNYDE